MGNKQNERPRKMQKTRTWNREKEQEEDEEEKKNSSMVQ